MALASHHQEKVNDLMERATVTRLQYFTWITTLPFFLYGFMSYGFIHSFDDTVTLSGNLWPRLFFGCFPMMLLAAYLQRSSLRPILKIKLWLVAFALIYNATSLIHVWPIAWRGSPQILLFVNGTNAAVWAVIVNLLALRWQQMLQAVGIIIALVWLPLFFVTWRGGDYLVLRNVINEMAFLSVASIATSLAITKGYWRLASVEVSRQEEAIRFLGPVVSKAIYEGRTEILAVQRVSGFVVSLDIRDSTVLYGKYKDRWLDFRRAWVSRVSEIVKGNNGYVQKTMGDGLLINFGVMEYVEDLSQIPGIEHELFKKEAARLKDAARQTFTCVHALAKAYAETSRALFPDYPLSIGIGIDHGIVEKGLQGDGLSMLELDVNGDPVNCSNRLQEYGKLLRPSEKEVSYAIIVVSPHAKVFLDQALVDRQDAPPYILCPTTDRRVRDYPAIEQVFVRTYIWS